MHFKHNFFILFKNSLENDHVCPPPPTPSVEFSTFFYRFPKRILIFIISGGQSFRLDRDTHRQKFRLDDMFIM